jgi:hypothetical protein
MYGDSAQSAGFRDSITCDSAKSQSDIWELRVLKLEKLYVPEACSPKLVARSRGTWKLILTHIC